MKNNNLRIAIQNKGRLSKASFDYLSSLGLQFNKNGRSLITSCKNYNLDVLFLRDDDIPEYVKYGVADFGIVGENVLKEQKLKVRFVKKLGFAKCSLVIAIPKDSSIKSIQDLEGERIATSYPNLLSDFFIRKKTKTAIIPIKGSVEAAPTLNLADAICDITQTGKTLVENDLVPLVTVLESQAVLIESPIKKNAKNNFLKL